ncbi:hypothetical protein E1A91_D05G206300v1 [Gossypium mustelinum]|uniref:BFN domain-containing protein n=1 Tax=Gossypium mustelinum TaxID=34275 RepID=A0A5D2UYS2_GOSMU|nr:hypothetical protein E1A91_D05G206300v1 [Gossypium mustelinum]
MVSLQGPVICPSVHSKQVGVDTLMLNRPSPWARLLRSDIWGRTRVIDGMKSHKLKIRYCKTMVHCSFSSSSDGSGSMAESFNEKDEDYVNSTAVEAGIWVLIKPVIVDHVKSGPDGFIIKMRDGRHLRCIQNNPQAGNLPDYAPHPAIVLKMEDGTGLLLPIIVLEMPSVLLMAAISNVQIPRPTMYQVVKDMIEKMGYSVKLVRVTKRVHEAYFAQLYLTKVGDETESVSFDLRPSDAINIAVRCKVPIQVNKYLAYSDGMRVIESGKLSVQSTASDVLPHAELDQPSGQPCLDSEEFKIVGDLNEAISQERYKDAADLRDKLDKFRAARNLRKFT